VRSLGPLSFAFVGAPLLVGALGGLGRPGIDCTPFFFGSELVVVSLALRAPSPWAAALVGASWGSGLFAFIALGSLSWGLSVPVLLTAIGVGLYALPLALWSWVGPRRFQGVRLFLATSAAWSLCLDLGDWLKFPLKESAQSLVLAAPALAAGARLVGSNVLSGVLLATTVLVAHALAPRQDEPLGVRVMRALPPLGSGLGVLALLGVLAQLSAAPAGRTLEIGVPQINAGSEYYAARLLRPELVGVFDRNFEHLLDELGGSELVVTTEGFDGRFGLVLPSVRARWQARAREQAQALAITSFTVEHGWKGNAVGAFDRQGRFVGMHRKVDLALEGEKMLAPGSAYEVFPLERDLTLGVPLCLESLLANAPFAMTRAGATLLAASTSDLSFGSNVTAFEHLATTALRAIETGRSIVWASNGGPSGIIDRFGRFEPAAPFRQTKAARMRATLHSDVTPYLRSVSAVRWVSAVLLVALGLAARSRREPPSTTSPSLALPVWSINSAVSASFATLCCVLAAGGLIVLGPALVEISRGEPARALASVATTLRGPRIYVPPSAFGRFRTSADASAKGAVAYFLAYYGIDVALEDLPAGLGSASSLDDVQAYLARQFSLATAKIGVEKGRLPRVAAIMRTPDGAYVVASDPGGDGLPSVFSPALGRTIPADPLKLSEAAGHVALVPK
jgi:apolipoprotein N-acyltransferase